MGWAILVINFAIASIQLNGSKLGPIVNAFLINIYLPKFFHWETGYFNTLDITLDRAGYCLCWGCLTWVQLRLVLEHFLSQYLRFQVFLNYMADYQKGTRTSVSIYLNLISGIWWRMFNMGEESKVHPCGIQNTSGQDKEEKTLDKVENIYVHIKYIYLYVKWLLGPLPPHELCL